MCDSESKHQQTVRQYTQAQKRLTGGQQLLGFDAVEKEESGGSNDSDEKAEIGPAGVSISERPLTETFLMPPNRERWITSANLKQRFRFGKIG